MSKLELRVFNQTGIKAFEELLADCASKGTLVSPDLIVKNPELTIRIGGKGPIKSTRFVDRMHCGQFFDALFNELADDFRRAGMSPVGNTGLWSWLAAVWLQDLTKNSKGNFFVGSLDRYVLSSRSIRDYRHLLYGPWLVFAAARQYPELIRIALNDEITQDSAVYEQIASRREIVSNRSALELINRLYGTEKKGQVKPDTVNPETPGALRRFGSVYSQLAVNYDLHAMDTDAIQKLLPAEFAAWLTA